MKKLLLVALMGTACYAQAQTIVPPSVKSKTTFAIVVDQTSYEQAKSEIEAYKSAVEQEGLGTYLLIDEWKSPLPIREQLKQWHADKKAPLEGCVFVGDIPVPMVRDAQHLCSAFKMAQSMKWHRSSVPSDRFYDDFGLEFDYLKADSVPARKHYHYVSLRADSKQYLSPDIYSARIRPLEIDGKDKYELLRNYLKKVVAEKKQSNVLDHLSMARGHGYNSEDLLAWSGEQLALREQLPQLFKPGNTVKFLDFTMQFPMKPYYLNEVLKEELDVMLFHHHGGPTAQYINGYPEAKNTQSHIEEVKRYLRSKVPGMAEKKGREAAIEYYTKQFGVPAEWCEEAFDPKKVEEDSLFNLTLDILSTDMHQLTPNARFVMFDACFTGSFQLADYLAGSYIFTDGKTIATQACSVNSIQDKWPDELLGLLAAGMRIGHFNRLICFLENHIMGDPTLRFTPNVDVKCDINEVLTLKKGDIAFWKKQLSSPLPDMQSLALRELSDADYKEIVPLLEETYYNSDLFVVRLQALRLLVLNHPAKAVNVLKDALNDSYELTRRYAGEYAEKNGSPELLSAWVEAYLQRPQEKRLRFKIWGGIEAFDFKQAAKEVEKQAAEQTWYDRKIVESFQKQFPLNEKSMNSTIALINDPKAKMKDVRSELRAFRNHPVGAVIDPMLALIKDETRHPELRLTAIEALGWYGLYYDKASLIARLKQIKPADPALSTELTKTINRLEGKNR
ncbi:MAG: HEAT repeat domain-containing protein [Bacteroidaceae bacterium]|nr:HEAT repeat domain-containing protein [Bacteroidaceae bacterium]